MIEQTKYQWSVYEAYLLKKYEGGEVDHKILQGRSKPTNKKWVNSNEALEGEVTIYLFTLFPLTQPMRMLLVFTCVSRRWEKYGLNQGFCCFMKKQDILYEPASCLFHFATEIFWSIK